GGAPIRPRRARRRRRRHAGTPRHRDAPPAAGGRRRGSGACEHATARLSAVSIYPISGLPEIVNGAPLADLIADALARLGMSLEAADVVVITQKVVSKAEGRVVSLDGVHPSARATRSEERRVGKEG